jgi:coenzyme F420-0:L-glutamate ligase / coenzyme F420-1:gamma-L-glutamate ligase
MLQILPVEGIGEIAPGTDLGALLDAALPRSHRQAGDVLVVTQKIVSKAEGRFVDLGSVRPGAEALRLADITRKDARLVELVLAESTAVLRAVPNVLITRHRCGWVMANAGIDRSNLGPGRGEQALLLPEDADASAARLHAATGLAVVISDSFGRPWRNGVTLVALGAAGLPALIDRRGEVDRDGRVLEVTQVALADMIANAAGLVMGEGAEGIPVALVRGLAPTGAPHRPAAALTRPVEEDLFQ